MAETIKFEGAGATNKECRLARLQDVRRLVDENLIGRI
jgi:hypothetical protein